MIRVRYNTFTPSNIYNNTYIYCTIIVAFYGFIKCSSVGLYTLFQSHEKIE
jgi:hypothetical protein